MVVWGGASVGGSFEWTQVSWTAETITSGAVANELAADGTNVLVGSSFLTITSSRFEFTREGIYLVLASAFDDWTPSSNGQAYMDVSSTGAGSGDQQDATALVSGVLNFVRLHVANGWWPSVGQQLRCSLYQNGGTNHSMSAFADIFRIGDAP